MRRGRCILFGLLAGLTLWLGACATTPPLQELSDARQAIQAAREAQAARYAPENLQRAEQALERATLQMEYGDYHEAREWARSARRDAVVARDQALKAAAP